MRGQLVYEPDISHAEFSFTQRLARAGLRALVAVPLLVESTVYGLLVAARRQPHSFRGYSVRLSCDLIECLFLK